MARYRWNVYFVLTLADKPHSIRYSQVPTHGVRRTFLSEILRQTSYHGQPPQSQRLQAGTNRLQSTPRPSKQVERNQDNLPQNPPYTPLQATLSLPTAQPPTKPNPYPLPRSSISQLPPPTSHLHQNPNDLTIQRKSQKDCKSTTH
jgi:hypothetical protein